MSRGRVLEVVLTLLGAVLLLIAAAGKHPYGFYMVLRLVITVGAVYWAWRVYKVGQRAWTWMFVAVALLLNPFLPIRMQRAQWQQIDLYLGILLIGWSGYWIFRKREDADKPVRANGSHNPGLWRWFWVNVVKYAAGYLVFIFLMVGIVDLLRWLVPAWMGRTFGIVFVTGVFALGAFGLWPDLRHKFRWPIACAIYLSLGALMFAGFALLAKYVILPLDVPFHIIYAKWLGWIFAGLGFVLIAWILFVGFDALLWHVRRRHAAKKR
jgi:hypothetical protein